MRRIHDIKRAYITSAIYTDLMRRIRDIKRAYITSATYTDLRAEMHPTHIQSPAS
jgi:hypothetical protein